MLVLVEAVGTNQHRSEGDLVFACDLLRLVGALEPLGVGALIPQLEKFGPSVILHRFQVCVDLYVRHDHLLQNLPGLFSVSTI